MNRREHLKHLGLLLGISVAVPGHAFDVMRALDSAKSLGTAATLDDAQLKQYFDQVSTRYDRENRVAPAGDPYARRLDGLTRGLDRHDGLDLNFKVYLTKDINAFAMGNGVVRVYSGLMDKMSDDEIRYVIGHEIGHVKSGHSKARMQAALASDAARNALGASGGRAGALADSQLGDLFQQVVLSQHSQSNENEADDYAMGFLKGGGHSPMAAVSALEKLDQLSGGSGGGWLSTHPAPAERAKRMRAQLA